MFKSYNETGVTIYWYNGGQKEGYTMNSYSNPCYAISAGLELRGKSLNLTNTGLYLKIGDSNVIKTLHIAVERIDSSPTELFFYKLNGIQYPSKLGKGTRILAEPEHNSFETELATTLGYILKFKQTYVIHKVN